MASQKPFRDIDFGKASAEEEAAERPELLTEGFVDRLGLDKGVIQSNRFLILGQKGSGKSAIAEHLRLNEGPNSFARTVTLPRNFMYEGFLSKPVQSGVGGYVAPWECLLLLHILESLADDNRAMEDPDFSNVVRKFQGLGLLSSARPQAPILLKSIRTPILFNLVKTLNLGREETKEVSYGNVSVMAESLISLLGNVAVESEHIISIDGLDEAFLPQEVELNLISSLILAAQHVNRDLRLRGQPVRVLILCRTDVFERLPGPNKNKIRSDNTWELEWYEDTRDPRSSALVNLAQKKAAISGARVDIFSEYFPDYIRERRTLTYLLDHTRHTPRDFLQLLTRIRNFSRASGMLSTNSISNGIREYSKVYFVEEIRDELNGRLSLDDIQLTLDLIGQLPVRRFTFESVEERAASDGRFRGLDLKFALRVLFDVGAIGNLRNTFKDSPRYTFKYRNRHADLDFASRMILHPAIAAATGIPER